MIERLLAGEAALARGELDDAGRLFSQVATADPRNAIALVGLARIAVLQDDPDEARSLAGRALAIDPDEAAALKLVAELDRRAAERGPVAEPEPVEPAPVEPARVLDQAPRRRGWRGWLDRLLRRR